MKNDNLPNYQWVQLSDAHTNCKQKRTYILACGAIVAFNAGHLHRIHQHAGQAEGHLFGEFLSLHGHFEAVAEVNVQYFAGLSVQHEVRRMAITQTKDIAAEKRKKIMSLNPERE